MGTAPVRSLKRTLLTRYSAAVVLISLMILLALAFGIRAEAAETVIFLVGIVLLAVMLGLITWWTERTLAADLSEIGHALKKIVVDNDLDHMPQPRLDELQGLARDLDTVAGTVRENYALLEQERDRLHAVLDSINAGIIVVGRDMRIRMINPVAEKVLGTSEKYALHKTFTEIHHAAEINKSIDLARAGESVRKEVQITLPKHRTLEIKASPITTETGKFAGVLCVLEDLSARRKLERVRKDFVANVSHELRTPVSSMRAVVEALLAGAASEPETAQKFLLDLDVESQRLADILEDLLVLSKIEARKVEMSLESFEASEMLLEILEEKTELATANAVTISLAKMDVPAGLKGNRSLIKTACSNLVDNAIKYNRAGGSVRLSIEVDQETVAIEVSDTGIGIPSSEQKKIFERFYRVDKARSRETGGTGLGLSIVKHAVEYHDGKVLMQSAFGQGSTFRMVFPSTPSLF